MPSVKKISEKESLKYEVTYNQKTKIVVPPESKMHAVPTINEALDKLKQLADGALNPLEVDLWATRIYFDENKEIEERIRKDTPVLAELLDDLCIVAALDENQEFLYTQSDFKSWLIEWEDRLKSLGFRTVL